MKNRELFRAALDGTIENADIVLEGILSCNNTCGGTGEYSPVVCGQCQRRWLDKVSYTSESNMTNGEIAKAICDGTLFETDAELAYAFLADSVMCQKVELAPKCIADARLQKCAECNRKWLDEEAYE